ncbi:MAG: CopG family transcriptional regulator [Gammaproteobacteria bacterium]|nr:CopG family transcriptional regulator [Gammaproteobacteria bacterium]
MTKPREEDRVQVNVRISEKLADLLDAKRVELQKKLGKIPTRSQVVRMALEEFLGRGGRSGGGR